MELIEASRSGRTRPRVGSGGVFALLHVAPYRPRLVGPLLQRGWTGCSRGRHFKRPLEQSFSLTISVNLLKCATARRGRRSGSDVTEDGPVSMGSHIARTSDILNPSMVAGKRALSALFSLEDVVAVREDVMEHRREPAPAQAHVLPEGVGSALFMMAFPVESGNSTTQAAHGRAGRKRPAIDPAMPAQDVHAVHETIIQPSSGDGPCL